MVLIASDRYPGQLLPVGARWNNNIGKPLAGSPDGLGETPVNLDGPYTPGVTNPYAVHVHPYPTRFHGGIYTRPVFDLPYVRRPHAVFKPDDFYVDYSVNGLGSLGGNSMGSTATGAQIFWYASKPNTKVTDLQIGLNSVLVSFGYLPIAETGILESTTLGAYAWAMENHLEDFRTQVPDEIIVETGKTLQAALKGGAKAVAPSVNPNPPVDLEDRVIPGEDVVVPKQEDPKSVVFPETVRTLEVPEEAPVEEESNTGKILLGLALAAGLGLYVMNRGKK